MNYYHTLYYFSMLFGLLLQGKEIQLFITELFCHFYYTWPLTSVALSIRLTRMKALGLRARLALQGPEDSHFTSMMCFPEEFYSWNGAKEKVSKFRPKNGTQACFVTLCLLIMVRVSLPVM